MSNRTVIALALAAAVLLASCGKSPDEGARHSNRVIEDARNRATGVGPAVPDTPRHTVLVVAPPSAPQLAEKQQAKIEADREVTETQIHGLMDRYSENLRNPAEKAKYQEQISRQLDTYKRQTLQLYKMQQAAATANAASATPGPN